jgi:hypothetical protein
VRFRARSGRYRQETIKHFAAVCFPFGIGYSEVSSINDAGLIVGATWQHAFLWRDGSVTFLDQSNAISQAIDINNAGQILGRIGDRTVIWENGATRNLTTLGTAPSVGSSTQSLIALLASTLKARLSPSRGMYTIQAPHEASFSIPSPNRATGLQSGSDSVWRGGHCDGGQQGNAELLYPRSLSN